MALGGDIANETHGDDGKQSGKMLRIPFVDAFKETPKMKEVAGIFFWNQLTFVLCRRSVWCSNKLD